MTRVCSLLFGHLVCVSLCSSCPKFAAGDCVRCTNYSAVVPDSGSTATALHCATASGSSAAAAGSKSAVLGDAAFAVFKMAAPMQECYFVTFCNIFVRSALSTVPFLRFIIGLSTVSRHSGEIGCYNSGSGCVD